MKNLILLFFLAIGLAACGGGSTNASDTATTPTAPATEQNQGPEYSSKFICPMHCKGSGAAAAGECPVCGMDYVANENWVDPHAGHNH